MLNLVKGELTLSSDSSLLINKDAHLIIKEDTNVSVSLLVNSNDDVNITIDDVDTNALLIRLDMEGICASGGSACTAGSVDPSHVLLAIGLTEKQANSSVRFSIGKFNTREEIEFTVKKLKTIVENLR